MSNHQIIPTVEHSALLPPSKNPLKRLYNWVLHWAQTPYGVPALFILSFAESSCFPIPPDVLLIALCMGSARRWAWFAFICTLASVTGGLAGYSIGIFLSNTVGETLLRWIGVLTVHGGSDLAHSFIDLANKLDGLASTQTQFAAFADQIRRIGEALASGNYDLTAADKANWLRGEALMWYNGPWGPWAVGIAGFTPIPYKVFTITAGMFEMNVIKFTIASTIGRSARFFVVGGIIGLTYRIFGDRIKIFIDRYFNWLSVIFVILLLGGFMILKYL